MWGSVLRAGQNPWRAQQTEDIEGSHGLTRSRSIFSAAGSFITQALKDQPGLLALDAADRWSHDQGNKTYVSGEGMICIPDDETPTAGPETVIRARCRATPIRNIRGLVAA